MVLTEDAKKLQ